MPSRRRHLGLTGVRPARWGALALLVRPAYIAIEFVVAAATTGGYSFLSDSVSRLGEVGCSAGFCSPRHELMNGSFVGFGVLLAGGALLLRRSLGPWVTGLLVVSGLSSVATGLAPLDRDATLHAIAAGPLFVAQPVALIVLGAHLRNDRPRLAGALLAAGVLTGAGALSFVLSGDSPASGALERLALWPVLVGLAGFAWTRLAPRDRPRSLQPRPGAPTGAADAAADERADHEVAAVLVEAPARRQALPAPERMPKNVSSWSQRIRSVRSWSSRRRP